MVLNFCAKTIITIVRDLEAVIYWAVRTGQTLAALFQRFEDTHKGLTS